ncbi:MAG: BatA domain-containing protein, partial [Planctomycetes bacterium]|nr:BatA domain-containing protein [Planctomycetota bacterium]
MSFLTPLYLFGIIAVGLPILLHLVRHQPKNVIFFSSLRFL